MTEKLLHLIPDACTPFDDPRDFLIWDFDWLAQRVQEAPIMDRDLTEYDQSVEEELRMFCTVMSPLSIISSIYNERLTIEMQLDCFDYATRFANPVYEIWKWNYSSNWANTARKWRWENFAGKEVVQFRWPIFSDDVTALLKKNYGVVNTYKWNGDYNRDFLADWVLDGDDFSNFTYGHAQSLYLDEWYNDYEVVNQYIQKYKDKNRYKIKSETLRALVKNWVHYPNVYMFIPLKWVSEELTPYQIKVLNALLKINSLTWDQFDGMPDFKTLQDLVHKTSNETRSQLKKYLW